MSTVRDAASAARDQPGDFEFITVDGTRLRYFDSGTGTPVVLLHGNGSMIEDFLCSGIWTMPLPAPGSLPSTVRALATVNVRQGASGVPWSRPTCF